MAVGLHAIFVQSNFFFICLLSHWWLFVGIYKTCVVRQCPISPFLLLDINTQCRPWVYIMAIVLKKRGIAWPHFIESKCVCLCLVIYLLAELLYDQKSEHKLVDNVIQILKNLTTCFVLYYYYYVYLCNTFLWPLRFGWLLVLSLY